MRKILVDGLYRNNTRVAILNDSILEDFEFETSEKESTRGNIYLAKVSRVENSLQAAFVDYGGEKNGFLSISEIHPDYFQIPKTDKEEFLKELSSLNEKDDNEITRGEKNENEGLHNLYRSYNIGDIIKKDQLLLVQVVKEERGNKGVSLTTYLSFPGRYFVLMTNTPKKVGISRKISNIQERGRIREIVDSFGISKLSGIIVRTAATGKSREELLKDYNYLASIWNQVREKTVKSQAPFFIHREDSLVKKIIREYSDASISEIVIEGEETFTEVSDFVKKVGYNKEIKIINYLNKVPIFSKYGVESHVLSLLSPRVVLPSGAYFIIQQTEALVAIDVNSGKVTSANNLEDTAIQTNLEAATEIARQLKLRKLSGLIVIDFIDMARTSNRILVENEIKKHLMKDKARVHIGRISQFGLLELSRQRTDQSMLESSGIICSTCGGSGFSKSPEYTSMYILRLIASNMLSTRSKIGKFTAVYLQDEVLLHIVNYKKKLVLLLEKKHNTKFVFHIDNHLKNDNFKIEFNHSTEFSSEEGAYSENLLHDPDENAAPEEPIRKGFFARIFRTCSK